MAQTHYGIDPSKPLEVLTYDELRETIGRMADVNEYIAGYPLLAEEILAYLSDGREQQKQINLKQST